MTAALMLRPLQASDLPQLAALHAAAFLDEPWGVPALATLLALPNVLSAGAELDGGLAGALLIRLAADEAEILTLVVASEHRRRGIATSLLRDGVARAWAIGAQKAFLEVGADNPSALALYRRLGWYDAGRRRKYYRRGADALILRFDLGSLGQP